MTDDRDEASARRGRPPKEDRSDLAPKVVSFKAPLVEKEALRLRVEQRSRDVGADARVTESTYVRAVVLADLKAHGCIDAAMRSLAAAQPEPAPAAPVLAAPAPPLELPPPAAALRGHDDHAAAPVRQDHLRATAAEEAPTKPNKPTPASARSLLVRSMKEGLSLVEAAKRSGLDRARLTHWKNKNPEPRGQLKPEQLVALDSALRRWLEEQGAAR